MIIQVTENKNEFSDFVGEIISAVGAIAPLAISKVGAGKDRNATSFQSIQNAKIAKYNIQQAAYESEKAKEKKNTILGVTAIILVSVILIVYIFKSR